MEVILYILFLMGIMITSGIVKDQGYMLPLFHSVLRATKSNRLAIVLFSAVSGILPIPGRVAVSAGVLDTVITKEPKARAKFGIIDYFATHHYYLWSPLEKTIIIPMAALGLTYMQVIAYTFPLLLVTLAYTGWVIWRSVSNTDFVQPQETVHKSVDGMKLLPIPCAIAALVAGAQGWIVFSITSIIYMILTKTTNVLQYLKPKLLLFVAGIILLSQLIAGAYVVPAWITTSTGLALASLIGFGLSFALGSSGKFAGITVILAQVFGVALLPWFFAIEYSAYLLSPVHKCVAIGKSYFNTPLASYYPKILVLAGLLIITGAVCVFIPEILPKIGMLYHD